MTTFENLNITFQLAKGEMKFVLPSQPRRIPMKTYVLLAVVSITSMSLSNASLGYLNYPIQVVFKSCKLIPVLLGSFFIQKKVIKLMDFFAASLMCLGLIIFTLADQSILVTYKRSSILVNTNMHTLIRCVRTDETHTSAVYKPVTRRQQVRMAK